MGRVTFRIADFDAEISTFGVPTSDLTAANIDAEYASAITFQTALDAVQRGLTLNRAHVAKISPQAVGKSADDEAQREEKALIMYYDDTTFERATAEMPCVDMGLQMTGHPGVFYIDGEAGHDAAWTTFVSEFEAIVVPPGGNTAVIERIIHVGRNL